MPSTYQFPLEDQTRYPGRISFQVLKTTGYGIEVGDVQNDQAANSVDLEAFGGPGDALSDLGDIFGQLKNSTLSGPRTEEGDLVDLYMPQGIQVQDGVQFDNVDFGMRGATAFENAGTLGGAAARILNPMGDINALTDALRSAPNKGEYASVGAAYLANKAGSITGAIVSSALQTTTNPNTRAVFKSVPLREFTFSFKMLPQSAAEAREIENIVKLFREEIYPDVIKLGNAAVAYKFPNKFAIGLRYGTQSVGIQILPSYLTNISTTYNGSSQSFYKDGKFHEIDLTLTFRESRTLSREDITHGITATGNTNPLTDNFALVTGPQ
tara:strand:- start:6938 stop:7912 length:975 start_codon:yes stop_codon:yes gene_type:complete